MNHRRNNTANVWVFYSHEKICIENIYYMENKLLRILSFIIFHLTLYVIMSWMSFKYATLAHFLIVDNYYFDL